MDSRARILVVDDHPSNLKAIRSKLGAEGHEILEATNGEEAVEKFEAERPDLVLLDIMMPGMDGYEVCARIKNGTGEGFTPVILVTAKTDTESLVKGFEIGADDYITKPFLPIELVARVRAMLRIRAMYHENRFLREELARSHRFDTIIGESAEMKRVFALVEKVLDRDVTVLLTGETGTGKEAFARAIHYKGPRQKGRFVAVNCGAFSEGLLESELFGHKRGAFTGATEDKVGLFEAAGGGTVFLDEVSETSPGFQVKLLRALQEQEVTRVGDVTPRKIDVRVIAATNKDLELEIKEGRFREDLFYRLSVFPLRLPPLRERREDIPLLAQHFLERFAAEFQQDCPGFTPEASRALAAFDWPGNVRELANEVQRALVLAEPGEEIGLIHLSDRVTGGRLDAAEWKPRGRLREAVEAVEREVIQQACEKHEGNKTHMAEELGISRWTLLQKMRAYGLESDNPNDDG
jgi:DNA-binding NtrC family response regulator